jgi:N-formylglutamate amidohydrolase
MLNVAPLSLHRGDSPLLISVPHAGTLVPDAIASRLSAAGRAQPDADHLVDRLYAWAPELGASLVCARYSRYVVDLNRPPDDSPLYETAGSGLLPLQTFAGDPVYRPALEPDAAERRDRLERFWLPYHDTLQAELAALRRRHGHALLFDAHSISSRVPRLFDGRLPVLNLGSNDGASADPSLRAMAWETLSGSAWSHVMDGRFKGGYITRHYGQPEKSVHALQLEIAQDGYMNEERLEWDEPKAAALSQFLRNFALRLRDWKPGHG